MAGTSADIIELPAETVVSVEDRPTPKEAEDAGLDPREIAMGQKNGAVVADKAAPAAAAEPAPKPPAAAAPPPPDPLKPAPKDGPAWMADLSHEEKSRFQGMNQTEQGLYAAQRKEKFKRQSAQAERDKAKIDAAYWKGKAEAAAKLAEDTARGVIPAPAPAKPADALEDDLSGLLDDEYPDGRPAEDPAKPAKDKPLTRADLDQIEKDKAEKQRKDLEARQARVNAASLKLDEQENAFKEDHPDFLTVFDHAKEILDSVSDEKKLTELFPDAVQRRGVKSMVAEFAAKMTQPDKVQPGDDTAAALAYQLGKLNPKFKPSNAGEDETGDRDEAPSDLETRLDRHGRPSSAPLNGGNRNTKTLGDLTLEDVHKLGFEQFRAFKKKYPDVLERLLRESEG